MGAKARRNTRREVTASDMWRYYAHEYAENEWCELVPLLNRRILKDFVWEMQKNPDARDKDAMAMSNLLSFQLKAAMDDMSPKDNDAAIGSLSRDEVVLLCLFLAEIVAPPEAA